MDNADFTIVIRVANQTLGDQNIAFDPELTVEDLKRKIESDYPGNPETSKQRLIYRGKILTDCQQMKTILNESNQIIHLVYDSGNKKSECEHRVATETSTTEPELRQRFSANSGVAINEHLAQSAVYPMHMHSAEVYSQWMQQYQQHYTFMMQYYAGQVPQQLAPVETVEAEETTGIPNRADQPAANAQDAAARRDIQGGMMAIAENDNENEGRDWLDALFALTRFGFLLSIVYFYSSTYRFVLTLAVLFGIYLYQAGFFRVNRRPGRVQDPNVNNPQPATDDNNNHSADDEPTNSPPLPPPTPGVFATAWCFVRSFFSSLVPTGPPGIVN